MLLVLALLSLQYQRRAEIPLRRHLRMLGLAVRSHRSQRRVERCNQVEVYLTPRRAPYPVLHSRLGQDLASRLLEAHR